MSRGTPLCWHVLAALAPDVAGAPTSRPLQATTVRRAFDRLLSLHEAQFGAFTGPGERYDGLRAAGARPFRSGRGGRHHPPDHPGAVVCDRPEARACWRETEILDTVVALLLAPVQEEADLTLKLVVLIAMSTQDCGEGRGPLNAGLRALLADLTHGSSIWDRSS